jgi:hypothetical protein
MAVLEWVGLLFRKSRICVQTFNQLQFAFLSRKIALKVFTRPRSLRTEDKDLRANRAYIVNKYVLISYNLYFMDDVISLRK